MRLHAFRFCMASLLCAMLALTLTPLSFAQHAAKSGPSADSGQKAAVDNSGKLRQPTEEEVQALSRGLENHRSSKGLKPTQHADGSVSVALDERFESTSMARINADGTVSQACVESKKQAETFLKTDQSKKKTTEQPLEEK